MDRKLISELEELYKNTGWAEDEKKQRIRNAYGYVMKQREAQAKYGTVDANDPQAVQAAAERQKGGVSAPAVSSAASGYDAAAAGIGQAMDKASAAAVAEVEQARDRAAAEYQAQRDAVAVQAANDADASALYSELRGDRGGIGKAQYDSVKNNAAKNQAEISRAQTEMARAAATEIAQLQASGEYEKAEKLLDAAQERLSALLEMEKWAAEYSADSMELQEKLRQWQAEYELERAKLTGRTASGELTADAKARLAALGEAMLKKGLLPSQAQLSAMGMTAAQAREYIRSTAAR